LITIRKVKLGGFATLPLVVNLGIT